MKHSTIQKMLIPLMLVLLVIPGISWGKVIHKSPHDKRLYKNIILNNKLEVLLISDPETDQSAASLSIRAGLFDDPANRNGLAHFLEHMLFLGNQKYPTPGDFDKYLSSHGGSSNANTNNEETNYFFSVQSDYLNEALDRFSNFFISPSFYPEYVNREVNAVHSEYQKSLKNDGNRILQVIKETANNKHPIHKFGMGNNASLLDENGQTDQLYQDLIRFYKNHYSANLMKLVILGSEPLEQLEKYAQNHFSKIQNRSLKRKKIEEPIIAAKLPRLISIKPIKQVRRLKVMFQIPSQIPFFKYKPEQVISSLIGDEGPGSLLSYLKQKGWVTSLSSGGGLKTHDHSMFEIGMGLTKSGVHQVEKIMTALYSYINLIKAENNRQRYYRELAKLARVEFQFQEKDEPIWYVKRLAANLQIVPPEDVLTIPWQYEKYRPDLENDLLNYFKPQHCQLILIAGDIQTDLIEKRYEVDYSVKKFSESIIQQWENPPKIDQFRLPPLNPFIPDKIVLKTEKYGVDEPILLSNTPKSRIWFKHDDTFNTPKGNLRIMISNPIAYATVENAIKTKLFTKLLQENLNEYSYPAATAGLKYSLFGTTDGLVLNISGYTDKMEVLLAKILEGIHNFDFIKEKFEVYKEQMLDYRLNQEKAPAYRRNMYENLYLLSESFWHFDQYIKSIPAIEPEAVRSFVPELFKNVNIEVLAHGNFSISEIRKIGKMVESSLKINGASSIEIKPERTLMINPNHQWIYGYETSDVNSAIQLYYQAGMQDYNQKAALEVVSKVLEKPFYHQLRTIDQLGYLVSLSTYNINKVDGFVFLIQSGEKDPIFLEKRVEGFIAENQKLIYSLKQTDLDQIVKILVDNLEVPPKNLNEETKKYWNAITMKEYDFNIYKKEIAALKALKLEDIKIVFKNVLISPESVKRISFHAWGKNHQKAINKNNWIKDIYQFKKSSDYYPNDPGKITSQLLER